MSHPVTLNELFEHIRHYEPHVYARYEHWFNAVIARYQAEPSVPASEIRDLPMYNCCDDDNGAWEQKVKIGKFYLRADIEALIAKVSAQEKV